MGAPTTPLDSLLPRDLVADHESRLIRRSASRLRPHRNVVKQLLRPSRLCLAGNCVRVTGPTEAINSALLKKHFQKLTEDFLRPLEQYFEVPTRGIRCGYRNEEYWPGCAVAMHLHVPAQCVGFVWFRGRGGMRDGGVAVRPYDELQGLTRRFDHEGFLQSLGSSPPMPLFSTTKLLQLKDLYRSFICGTNFWPWFSPERQRLQMRLTSIHRTLIMRATGSTLINQVGTDAAERHALFLKVKNALAVAMREPPLLRDKELCAQMQKHLDVIGRAIGAVPKTARTTRSR